RNPAPMQQDYAELCDSGHLWVSEHDGEIGGMLVCFPKHDAYFVETAAVDTGQQGRGHGRLLMQHAEALAAAHERRSIILYTNAAMTENIAFYDRLGYSITERRNEDGFERIYFAKAIDAPR
ncbi:MAG: GNAT family N-acetyltransferase, partial [Pseudomonadota bacterium]